MTLSHCHDASTEDLHFLLRNRQKRIKHSYAKFKHQKGGAWEMVMNALLYSYMALYKHIHQRFAEEIVEQIYPEQSLEKPLKEDDDIGEALKSWTIIPQSKDIPLGSVKFEFYNANAIRHLGNLKLSGNTIYPCVLS
ncbi:uncharacterized protein ATC70_000386 [Mucor velutinosus]|uniref:Uncharacterized protein n=1 Tax=Mucor velutinosus TaxID=708070 RepID=A0AAN7I137_9FUNG|nr:hypothetical protein ATC70_000386 [Mucor velutinosus]